MRTGGIILTTPITPTNKIDFAALNSELLPGIDTFVQEVCPGGKFVGNEYLPVNPTRPDNKPGSFAIRVKGDKAGSWMDGATGDRGGDLISLYAYVNRLSQGDAARALSRDRNLYKRKSAKKTGAAVSAGGATLCVPIPANAPPPPSSLWVGKQYLKPDNVYVYTSASGAPAGYIYRFNAGNGGLEKKEFRPVTYWKDATGKVLWRPKGFPDNRPLYNLHELEKRHDDTVLVVSGEKCADAAREKLSEYYVVTTWHGGDGGTRKTDFAPLKNREIIWWPDNDASSKNCMMQLAHRFGGRVLEITQDDYKKGWDCADAVAAGLDLQTLINRFMPANSIVANENISDLSVAAPFEIFPHVTDKGGKRNTIENLQVLLEHYGIEVWYDVVTKHIGCNNVGNKYGDEDGDKVNNMIERVKSLCALNGISDSNVKGYIRTIASQNRKNPVLDWINSKPWDGERRLKKIIDAVEHGENMDEKLKCSLMIKWFVSAYAAANRRDGDDFRLRGCIVFQGEQTIGKTSYLRSLCGAAWGGNSAWFGEGKVFNAENKDHIRNANMYWIYEFGELENTTRFSIASLKAYLTNPVNTLRKPYGYDDSVIWSRTVYSGSVNQMSFLADTTGSSRFWCIPVVKFHDISKIDMQQVWAEVKRYHDVCVADGDNYIWWLSPEEEAALAQSNLKHEAPTTADDLLGERLDWDAPQSMWREATASQLIIDCGVREDTAKALSAAAGKYLHRQGFMPRHNGRARVYRAPPAKNFVHGNQNDNQSKGGGAKEEVRQSYLFE